MSDTPKPSTWMQVVMPCVTALVDLIWPRVCLVCDRGWDSSDNSSCLCATCYDAVLNDTHASCPRCTSTIGPHTDTTNGCLRCRNERFQFEAAVRLGPYEGLRRIAILRMKQLTGETLAEQLGREWALARREILQQGEPQILIPIPLFWRRRWVRGYNQSAALAEGIGSVLGLPVRSDIVRRVRSTSAQRLRSRTERRENVRDAFRVVRPQAVHGLRVLLIDDVLTTGSTADAVAGVLRRAGAAQVRLAVLAHR
ncbi:MAG: ComF family protein [Bacteroidales bacterium]|nr:ComF family protein [Bacteroidales bacterium]